MRNVQTDLAVEAHESYVGDGTGLPDGVDINVCEIEGIKRTLVKIITKEAGNALGKKQGDYITIEYDKLQFMSDENKLRLTELVECEIKKLLEKKNVPDKGNVLVVGLGNHDITPDAIGPLAVSKLDVTRHLFSFLPAESRGKMRPVSAIAPGVLGTTGIETQEIISAVTEKTKPTAIIAIDALASRSMDRLGRTIQVADTGIEPGSGVGNKRKGLNFESLGVPVIAVGVPTVADAATVADDAVAAVLSKISGAEIDEDKRYNFVKNAMGSEAASMMVTLKEIDLIVKDISGILADGINGALHRKGGI